MEAEEDTGGSAAAVTLEAPVAYVAQPGNMFALGPVIAPLLVLADAFQPRLPMPAKAVGYEDADAGDAIVLGHAIVEVTSSVLILVKVIIEVLGYQTAPLLDTAILLGVGVLVLGKELG